MPTDPFSTGYKGTKGRRRSRNNRALHQGRLPQPDVPTGDRNRAATERARAGRTPTTAAQIPTSVRREHEGRVYQPGVPGKRAFGHPLTAPLTPLGDLTKGLGLGLEDSISPELAARQAYETGDPLTAKQRSYIGGVYGKKALHAIEHLRAQGRDETLKEPEDLTTAILAATGVGDIAALIGKGGAEGIARVAAGTAAKDATAAAEKEAATSAVRDAFTKVAAKKTAAKETVVQAAKDAEPEVIQRTREKAQRIAENLAERTPASVKTAGKLGAKAAAYPVRHPITSPIALQVPTAFIHGDPKALEAGFSGQGAYANITNALAGAASHVSPVLGEAVSLPASVLPSAYLAGKAGVSAASGNTKELDELLKQWEETGVLPKLLQGDLSGAASNLGSHPLYGALELSGAGNALGRGAGAVSRALPGEFGELSRPDLPVRGTNVNVNREYSRDAIRQAAQRAYDRTDRGKEVRPDTLRGRHYLKERANRFTSNEEAIRREHARKDLLELKKSLPKKHLRIDRGSADVVNLAVERIIRSPETYHRDMGDYKTLLEEAQKARTEDGKPALNKREMAANKDLIKQIDAAIKKGDPGSIVDSADRFIEMQRPILDELVDLKLLSPEQAAKASATSFARVHLGAGHDKELGLVDKKGKPLSLDQIQAEMRDRGIDPPGFLSHRAPANSDFYQPSFGGASLEKGGRTGKAVVSGSQLGGIESLVRQLRRSRGLVDRAKAWHKAVNKFGVEVKGVETMSDARRIMEDPERLGIDPAIEPVAVPRYPFTAKKNEIEGALEHQNPAIAGEGFSAALGDSLKEAADGTLPDDAKVVFMPGKVVEQLRKDAEPSDTGLKAGQALTTTFKRAVLPFSPSFFVGNFFDNYMRAALAGNLDPVHIAVGVKAAKNLNDEERAQLLAGAHFSSVDRLAPHRSVEQIVKGQDALSKSARAFAEWSHKQGAAQAAVKFGPQLVSRVSHLLLTGNAAVTEVLPQYGTLGKLVLKDIRKTQGSWVKAITTLDEGVREFAKGVESPEKMIQAQKALEEVYGRYSQMSPTARKVWSTITPFWTWTFSAYKFVYLTMPAHRSVMTGLLAAAANATRAEREQLGLARGEAPNQVPNYYNGIPLPDGGVFPLARFNSFDFASDPLEALSSLSVPQLKSVAEAIAGRTWKGEEIQGSGNRVKAALGAAAGSFIPLINDLTEEGEEGSRHLAPHLALPHPVSAEKVEKSRQPWETISVPVGGEGSSDSTMSEAFDEAMGTGGESAMSEAFSEMFGE